MYGVVRFDVLLNKGVIGEDCIVELFVICVVKCLGQVLNFGGVVNRVIRIRGNIVSCIKYSLYYVFRNNLMFRFNGVFI